MKQIFLTMTLVCALSGCGERQDRAPEAVSETASSQLSSDSSSSDVAPSALNSAAEISASSASEDEVVTLTDQAARALRITAQRHNLGQDYYVRVVVERRGPAEYRCDLNFTSSVDPAVDIIALSKGIRVVVNRTNAPYIRGGIVDFADGGRGFQFRKPADARQQTDPAPALSATTPTFAPSKVSANTRSGISSGPYSNIHQADYVGPQACAKCHVEQYELWRTHPHSRMNRDAGVETVLGDFSGEQLEYADGTAVFDEQDGVFRITIFQGEVFVRRYRVTRTVGSRIFQMYIGIQTAGPEPADDAIYTDEKKLPFAYWIDRREWFPESYDEPISPTEYDRTGALTKSYAISTRNSRPCWDENCLWCHNTYPYEARLQYRATGFPHDDLTLTSISQAVPRGRTPGKRSFPSEQLVTLGISCESCHFGGREHVVEEREIRFVPCSEDLQFPRATMDLIAGARKSPYVVNSICSQCHSVRQPRYPGSASTWNSGEAADLRAGACASAIRCTDCHDPHTPGPPLGGGPDHSRHIESCLRCHETYQDTNAAAAHARHSLSSDVSCLDCHMPRIVHGLQTVVRSHQISSPTEIRMLSKGAPNACNMCHLDRSIQWTLDELKKGWDREVEPSEDWKKWYGGSLESPTGLAWLRHPAPMARQVAADAYSRSPLGESALSDILTLLNDRDPPTRMFALFAVERILGRQLALEEYSPWAQPEKRAEQVKALQP